MLSSVLFHCGSFQAGSAFPARWAEHLTTAAPRLWNSLERDTDRGKVGKERLLGERA